ncbi:hypothetical protein ACWEPB_20260 [Kitasatospora cineracea]
MFFQVAHATLGIRTEPVCKMASGHPTSAGPLAAALDLVPKHRVFVIGDKPEQVPPLSPSTAVTAWSFSSRRTARRSTRCQATTISDTDRLGTLRWIRPPENWVDDHHDRLEQVHRAWPGAVPSAADTTSPTSTAVEETADE